MTPRLAASVLVNALIRRAQGAGGTGAVLAKGDATAGSVLLICCDRGETRLLIERLLQPQGDYRWARTGLESIGNQDVINQYLERRRRMDPDIWLVELDIPGVERFAAEMMDEG